MDRDKKLKKLLKETETDYLFDEELGGYKLYLCSQTERVLKAMWPLDGVADVTIWRGNDLTLEGAKLLSHARDLKELVVDFATCDPRSFPPECFRYFAAIPRLEDISVDYSPDIDEMARYLSESKSLRRIYIGHLESPERLTDAGMKHISAMRALELISVTSSLVTNAGLACLVDMPAIRELSFDDCDGINDEGMTHVAKQALLRKLYLSVNVHHRLEITDRGVEYLRGLDYLEDLAFSSSGITDASLKWIGGLRHLQTLYLDGTDVTDAGVAHLFGHPTLWILSLLETRVSLECARQLQGSLLSPNASVSHESLTQID